MMGPNTTLERFTAWEFVSTGLLGAGEMSWENTSTFQLRFFPLASSSVAVGNRRLNQRNLASLG